MPELRKDPIVGRWVIISTDRAKRPTDFTREAVKMKGGFCPFCSGNESKTPPEIQAYRPNPNGGGAPQTAAQTALLGVEVADASAQGTTGALVIGVQATTPAESAGLAAGDVIVTFGGRSITSPAALSAAVKAAKPGDRVQVAWLDQGGQRHSATVQLTGASAPAA